MQFLNVERPVRWDDLHERFVQLQRSEYHLPDVCDEISLAFADLNQAGNIVVDEPLDCSGIVLDIDEFPFRVPPNRQAIPLDSIKNHCWNHVMPGLTWSEVIEWSDNQGVEPVFLREELHGLFGSQLGY